MCHDGGIDWAVPSCLTAIIRLNSTPSIDPSWFVSRVFRWAERRRSIIIAHILTFTAVANITNIPVIHFECPAAHWLVTVRMVGVGRCRCRWNGWKCDGDCDVDVCQSHGGGGGCERLDDHGNWVWLRARKGRTYAGSRGTKEMHRYKLIQNNWSLAISEVHSFFVFNILEMEICICQSGTAWS